MRTMVLLAAGLALAGRAEEVRTYRLEQGPAGPGIDVSLHYTFGTHEDHVVRALGEVRLDPDAPQTMSGALRVRIADLRSDSAERDCHMREALGLDYTRSQFPREHVCVSDAIPPGQVAYPEILLEIHGATAPSVAMLQVGKETPIELDAAWTIHGVTRPARLKLTASRDAKTPGAVRVRGTSPIRLADFGIVVKSAKVLFVTSSVDEAATVHFDVKLAPAR